MCTCVKRWLNAGGDARALWHAKVPQLQLENKGADDTQQRGSRLALAHLTHSLANNLQVATIVVPSRCCHGSKVIGAPSKGHCE